MQFGPRGVRTDLAGETVERGELDPMRQRDRFPFPRQQDEEPARPHAVDAKDTCGGRVDAAEVVEQPGVGT